MAANGSVEWPCRPGQRGAADSREPGDSRWGTIAHPWCGGRTRGGRAGGAGERFIITRTSHYESFTVSGTDHTDIMLRHLEVGRSGVGAPRPRRSCRPLSPCRQARRPPLPARARASNSQGWPRIRKSARQLDLNFPSMGVLKFAQLLGQPCEFYPQGAFSTGGVGCGIARPGAAHPSRPPR
jgi:hypothetical protein